MGRRQTDEGRVPANLEAEKSILSMILQDPTVLNHVVEQVKPDDLYAPANAHILQAIMNLSDRNEHIDRISVQEELERGPGLKAIGGASYLFEVEGFEASAAGLEYYVRSVRGKSLIRRMVQVAETIVAEGLADTREAEGFLDWAEGEVFRVSQIQVKPSYQSIKEVIKKLFDEVQARKLGKSELPLIPTGFQDLDEKLGGLHTTDLIILAARPGMGKTALALNIALHAARESKKHVVVFSLEMSAAQLVTRLISTLSANMAPDGRGLRGDKVLVGDITNAQMEFLAQVVGDLYRIPMVVDDTPALSIVDLRARARRLKAQGRCDLIVVDYLQLMRGTGTTAPGSREQEVAEISRSLKALAKELGIPVLALSQLNRMLETRKDKEPQLSDLRESGSIEQDADVILFIYRDDMYKKEASEQPGVAKVIIGKHRHGSTGDVLLRFDSRHVRFQTLAKGSDEGYFHQ
ncbi:MAG: replicative DNA helicase [Deltaproteobacteria bacterium]|nr:replicative DNA helicase [Deltaproteobacteria bacterium]